MRAVSQGHVAITSADPHANPSVDHRYGTDPDGHDRAVLTDALQLLRDITRDTELAAVLGPEHRPDRHALDNIVSYCHPAGTCKMGPARDTQAVVDARGAVHGVSGLYVADASIMPTITRGNINLPTAMIGARIAAGLLSLEPSEACGAQAAHS
jgi:choline dehydrogenase